MSTNISMPPGDASRIKYRTERIHHWDRVSPDKSNPRRIGAYYQQHLQDYFRFLVPPGQRVLEFGCGHGDLLAAVEPVFGVGIDFSAEMLRAASRKHPQLHFIRADVQDIVLKCCFDVIILSDLVNDLWDVQGVLDRIAGFADSQTRVVINFFNNLWRIPLAVVRRMGLGADVLEQNWFAPHDVHNLLELSGFEVVKKTQRVLMPLQLPGLSALANRYAVQLPVVNWLALTNIIVARPKRTPKSLLSQKGASVTVVVPARNESGNIESILRRVPELGSETEIVFVEGNSSDDTFETIQKAIDRETSKNCRLFRQSGQGKGDAVRLGFQKARGDILMILDADMTVPPEDLGRFYDALISGQGEFINGVRLVYPLENESMRFFNILGNKFFSLAFSWLLGQSVKDTLCGTKVLWKRDYERIAANRSYFGDFDPFGDFDLLFGAAKLNLKIAEMPIRYRARTYGNTNIDRWRHGWLLLKMTVFGARRMKFI
ncbi:MAG TPA: glycosyltransferase [Desulfobacterales bacterium]